MGITQIRLASAPPYTSPNYSDNAHSLDCFVLLFILIRSCKFFLLGEIFSPVKEPGLIWLQLQWPEVKAILGSSCNKWEIQSMTGVGGFLKIALILD
jgi:predicted neuraminidase